MTLFDFPGQNQKPNKVAAVVLTALVLAHIVATWGYTGFWGDPGRWRHEVDRFAQGEFPYRDYVWQFPPAAMWLLGGIARVFGSGVDVLFTATSLVCVLIFVGYYCYVSTLLSRFTVLVTISGFLLSTAYANLSSDPLPAGMYTPAAPIGFLFLLLALLISLRMLIFPRRGHAFALGVACALCILTKQDFWLPAAYLLITTSAILSVTNQPDKRFYIGAANATFAIVLLTTTIYLARNVGWRVLFDLVDGFGSISETAARNLPSGERITADVFAASLVALTFIVCLTLTRAFSLRTMQTFFLPLVLLAVLAAALHVSMSYRIGLELDSAPGGGPKTRTEWFLANALPSKTPSKTLLVQSVGWLKHGAQNHILSVSMLILVTFVVIAGWQRLHPFGLRNTVLFLSGFCVTTRFRRLFEHVEWYHFLLEIPLYVLAATLFIGAINRRVSRAFTVAIVSLVILGLYSYWDLGVGPLTRKGTYEFVETPRGWVRWNEGDVDYYRRLDAVLRTLDDTGKRPFFAFGISGGYNYYLRRSNPTPLTSGFRVSFSDPWDVLAKVKAHKPAPVLMDTNVYKTMGAPGYGWTSFWWELKMVNIRYVRYDRRYFDVLLSDCKKTAEISADRWQSDIYDCK